MKKTSRFIKSMTALCLTVVMLMGMGMQVKAANSEIVMEWEAGWSYTLEEGDSVIITIAGKGAIYRDGVLKYEGAKEMTAAYKGTVSIELRLDEAGNKGVYITTRPTKADVPSVGSGSVCSHNYEWNTEREATAAEDGLASYKCVQCGQVDSWMATSAYYVFNKDAADAVRKAEQNAAVTITTRTWESFHKSVFDAITARPDVAVTVNYTHQHKDYTVTIPAGADTSKLVDEGGFCGFRNLDAVFGGSEISK